MSSTMTDLIVSIGCGVAFGSPKILKLYVIYIILVKIKLRKFLFLF